MEPLKIREIEGSNHNPIVTKLFGCESMLNIRSYDLVMWRLVTFGWLFGEGIDLLLTIYISTNF